MLRSSFLLAYYRTAALCCMAAAAIRRIEGLLLFVRQPARARRRHRTHALDLSFSTPHHEVESSFIVEGCDLLMALPPPSGGLLLLSW